MVIKVTIEYGGTKLTYEVNRAWSLQEIHMIVLKIQKLIDFEKR